MDAARSSTGGGASVRGRGRRRDVEKPRRDRSDPEGSVTSSLGAGSASVPRPRSAPQLPHNRYGVNGRLREGAWRTSGAWPIRRARGPKGGVASGRGRGEAKWAWPGGSGLRLWGAMGHYRALWGDAMGLWGNRAMGLQGAVRLWGHTSMGRHRRWGGVLLWGGVVGGGYGAAPPSLPHGSPHPIALHRTPCPTASPTP